MTRKTSRFKVAPPSRGVAQLTIERLGAKGDGIGHLASGEAAYVAFALPGEDVRVRLGGRRGDGVEAELEAVLRASPGRVVPPCQHFGQCGGCALQHLDPLTYRTLKSGRISGALARQGITGYEIAELLVTPPATRRRVTFSARVGTSTKTRSVVLGFNRRASHDVIDIGGCVVATPAITALLQPLRTLLAAILAPGQAADIVVTDASSGLDVLIDTVGSPDLAARESLAEFAADANLARLMWRSKSPIEPIAVRDAVLMRFGGRDIAIPPGAFLQATGFGEDAIVQSVLRGLPGEGRVADLFAGCGTLSFPIAQSGHAVLAVEGDEAALSALSQAARSAGGRIVTERRDLERSPLEPSELTGFAAVVFDPPRAGAKAQARCLARSEVVRVIAVSCDPESFARDAAILIEGGYQLSWVQPIDQFLWSSHVELVALFQRP